MNTTLPTLGRVRFRRRLFLRILENLITDNLGLFSCDHLSDRRWAMMLARSPASDTPENGITFPAINSCGLLRY
jgi:hypothetical protein